MADRYLLDSNIFISAHKKYYPFDIAPGFWSQLIEKGIEGVIAISKPVKDELLRLDDDLSTWLQKNEMHFIEVASNDQLVIQKYSIVINAVQKNSKYRETAKRQFANIADSWIIAGALAHGYTIVTDEVYSADSKRTIKIPNECIEHGINFINRTEFMRATHFLWK